MKPMDYSSHKAIRVCFIVFSLLALCLSTISSFSSSMLNYLALFFIATLGLSHGSLDWVLAKHWGIWKTFKQALIFFLAYLTIALLGFIFWYLNPFDALVLFLIISVWHFSRDWLVETSLFESIIISISIICIPTLKFHLEVAEIFYLLTHDSRIYHLTTILQIIGVIAAVSVCPIALARAFRDKNHWLAVELFVLIITALILPPLVFFSLYFCFLHALKHWKQMRQMGLYQQIHQVLINATWPVLVCIVFGALIYFYSGSFQINSGYLSILIIGLFMLTVPHWILLEFFSDKVKMKEI